MYINLLFMVFRRLHLYGVCVVKALQNKLILGLCMWGRRQSVPLEPCIFVNTCFWVRKLFERNNYSVTDERIVLVLAYGCGKERE